MENDFQSVIKYVTHHCVESFCIRTFSGLHIPVFRQKTETHSVNIRIQQMRENTDQENSEHGPFLHSVHRANETAEVMQQMKYLKSLISIGFKKFVMKDFRSC